MAEYQASAAEIAESIDNSKLSGDVKAAIDAILVDKGADGVATVQGNVSNSDVANQEAVLVSSDAKLDNLTLGNGTTALVVGTGTSGDVAMETQEPATVQMDGASVNLAISNDADNSVTLSNASGSSLSVGDGNNAVNVAGGTNVSVETGDGDNNITMTDATNASVKTGDGDDTISVNGAVSGNIQSGSGDLTLVMDQSAQENAQISVDAGDGFDLLQLFGNVVKHTFEFVNGRFHMHSADVAMTGVQVVAQDANSDGKIDLANDHITVLAENEKDSIVAKLYKVALGREAIDGDDGWGGSTLGGINWWMNEFEKQDSDQSMDHLVKSFRNCDEFHNLYDKVDDATYVNALLTNAGADTGLASQYLAELESGASREDVAYQIASTVEVSGIDGQQYVVDGF